MPFLTFDSLTGGLGNGRLFEDRMFFRAKHDHPAVLLSSCLERGIEIARVLFRDFDRRQAMYKAHHGLFILLPRLLCRTCHLKKNLFPIC